MKIVFVAFALFAGVSAAQETSNKSIPIVKQDSELHPNGSYHFLYKTGNGIQAEEFGSIEDADNKGQKANKVKGYYLYEAPDGSHIFLYYVADETGFHPAGDHLPEGEIPKIIINLD